MNSEEEGSPVRNIILKPPGKIMSFYFNNFNEFDVVQQNSLLFEKLFSSLDLEEKKKPVKNPLAGHDLVATQIALEGIKVSGDVFIFIVHFLYHSCSRG